MTESRRAAPDLPRLEQAALWLDRLRSGDRGEPLRQQFDAWRKADAANGRAFAEVERAQAAAEAMAASNEMLALRHETLSRLVMKKPPRRRGPAIAAGVAALVLGFGLVGWPQVPAPIASSRSADAVEPRIYETKVGERLSARLDDGSTVVLNTGSRLSVAFTATERRLVLIGGQALFEVAKGQKRPFVVQAGDQVITAHGTAFDVRMDPPQIVKVALIEGAVTVQRRSRPARAPTPLRPSEVLVASSDQESISRVPEVEQVTSWRDGLVVFDDESLAAAVAEMNRYVRQPIVLSDAKVGALRVSGTFRTGETAAFVEALEMSFPVRVTERTPEHIVLASR